MRGKNRYLILFGVIVLGYILRVYHLDYLPIGYHNVKENEYISQAVFMMQDKDFLHRKLFRMGMEEVPRFEEYSQMPILSWMFVVLWAIFGMHLWIARLTIVIFSLGSVIVLYYLVKRLAKNEPLALLSACLLAIMPLGVFFGRNIQPETLALFFLLLGTNFYLKWLDESKLKDMLSAGVALCLCACFKITFLIGIIPWIAVFPVSTLRDRTLRNKTLTHLLYFLICFLPLACWSFIERMLFKKETLLSGTWHRINIFEFFSPAYWKENFSMVFSYLQDNFTLWYYGLFIIGLVFVALKTRGRFRTFVFSWLIAIVPYGMFLSDFFRQHSYYQMPFLPLVCITCAFALISLRALLEKDTSLKWAKYAPLIFLIITFPALKSSINRQYDTIFYGLDIGADYLKSHMPPGSRFFALGHPQSVAVCALAKRLCGFGHPRSLEEFKFGEEKRNMGWLFAYGDYGIQELYSKKEMSAYLQDNYSLVQIGFLGTEKQLTPAYYIFKKGGKFNFDELKNIKKQPKLAKLYDTTRGSVPFYTLDLE